MKNVLLQGKNICKVFSNGGNDTSVLNMVDISIYEGDFSVIMGASGAGKSTLLYTLSGMDSITSGEIVYKDKSIATLSQKQMAQLRANEFGFVFQQTHLVSNLSLFENVTVAGYVGGKQKPQAVQEKASELLLQMNVSNAKNRLPSQVSGGEAQRAAIARAMISSPSLLFADEPTGALNKANSEDVLNLLSGLNEAGQSILMVTHDIKAALRGNRILYMEDGKILDEFSLPDYNAENLREREAKLTEWLATLRW